MIFESKPVVVGHRGSGSGSRSGYRENSPESYRAAASAGAAWVELDVRRSSDGHLVVWHDPASPAGFPVIGRTAAELAGEGIGTLAAILAGLPDGLGVDMDVKTTLADASDPPGRRTHALLATALRSCAGTRPLLVSSFDPSVPVYLKFQPALAGTVALGLLTGETLAPEQAVVAAANLGLDVACPYVGTLRLDDGPAATARIAEAASRAGIELMTWTATPGQAVRAAAAGFGAVCVDDVPGTVAALAAATAG